ncbi:metallophosphoesterase [Papillibacter cinnamivorans]|uniref:Calcineurin-like phosphoesterase domain-containing protein n=1 Tax=Papillibacter cinnamivorans DSM 12816 TaxID=1122930 RepID=A0A1W1YUD2_9FIRM|nr:metallophosphoesterase [Papillibacter cinnamivorans]SMC39746.1 hypothetical protein SAMN02745168_0665 [Papillibacter cinnamivorans DSM 12816]
MSLYTIGDLHLAMSSDKPMDVFGDAWKEHDKRLAAGFSALKEDDVTVLCGDLSWAMSLEEAREDFLWIHRLPGRKILLKGNHDYWWTTAAKMNRFFRDNGIDTLEILHNNCYFYGDTALCGTRGWFYEEDSGDAHARKVFLRELIRLEASLKAAGEREIFCFLHYPPLAERYECAEILELLQKYRVKRCYYGHLHGPRSHRSAVDGLYGGIEFHLVSADYLDFRPLKILE